MGAKECSKCRLIKDDHHFYCNQGNYCIECRRKYNKLKHRVTKISRFSDYTNGKECNRCKIIKNISEYYILKDKFYPNGLQKYENSCKQCLIEYRKSSSPHRNKMINRKILKSLLIEYKKDIIVFVKKIERRNRQISLEEMMVELITLWQCISSDVYLYNQLKTYEQVYKMYNDLFELVKNEF